MESTQPAQTGSKLYENYDLGQGEGGQNDSLLKSSSTPSLQPSRPAKQGDNTHIDIFVRVKPTPKPSTRLSWELTENKLEFNLPREASAGYVNNQREHYDFRFNGIIEPQAKQDEVFERVARGVVMGTLEGYNGTIFAYGQTGSGKTFTITGGPMHYSDRGIIPRTISTIFNEITKRSDHQFTVHVSYLEIYNETGYDLLDPDREVKAMEDLPQVQMMEDEEQSMSFRNLNIHRVNTEEEALNLLFLGDTNRTISETPMNQASSRSHCIFTLYVEARKHGEEVVRRSKLNLVDLAGSERASKTGIDGTTLREAKYINLSLHYLEQVIIALQERSMGINRPHIPYRNSKMTQVLRDSLGGNCRTVMIANISDEVMHLDESISTCRFAMRVALVRNVVALNEEVDPSLVIRRLKQEIRDLREEIRLLKGGEEERGPLTPDEILRLQEQVEAYCADTSPDSTLNLGGSMMNIRAAFGVFKQLVCSGGGLGKAGGGKAGSGEAGSDLAEQVKKLKLQVAQRDNEINILVGMIKRRDAAAGTLAPGGQPVSSSAPFSPLAPPASNALPLSPQGPTWQANGSAPGDATVSGRQSTGAIPSRAAASVAGSDPAEALLNASLLADRNQAFEHFRKSYRHNEVIEDNKATLKVKYDAAKSAAAAVNDSKTRINELKALIEQRRIQQSVARMGVGGAQQDEAPQVDVEEERCKAAIEAEKSRYKDAFEQLRGLKKEIEHLHMVLEQSRTRLQRDFDQWMALMSRQASIAATSSQAGAVQERDATSWPRPSSASTAGKLPTANSPVVIRPPDSTMSAAQQSLRASFTDSFKGQSVQQSDRLPSARSVPEPKQAWGDLGQTGSSLPSRTSNPAPSFNTVDPQVMAAARPFLTGNPEADQDIVRFYVAKHQLLAKLQGDAAGV